MEIQLTPGQESLIRYGMETGRLLSPEAAVSEAMLRWEEQERKRIELLAELEIGLEELKYGECTEITEESMKELAEEINREGREILAREQNSPLV